MTNSSRNLFAIFIVLLSLLVTDNVISAETFVNKVTMPVQSSVESSSSILTASALDRRIHNEKLLNESMFSIQPYKTNYLLPGTYNTSPNNSPNNGVSSSTSTGNENLDNHEVKFQLSFKTPLWDDIFGNNGTLFVAYTQLAFWQAYNSATSAPFREVNFEPEIFMAFKTDYELLGLTSKLVSIGFNHQSNGKSQPLSRSWNRIIADLIFESGNTYIALRPWLRIPEKSQDDDNPYMEKYYGYGELNILQKLNNHTLTLMLRNNLRTSGNKGAVQIDWSFPLHRKLKGYVQYFKGYGESLVDYNHTNNRIGVGLMLTDWL